jgi:predicted DNA-binding transcriptional regulator AlpA
MNSSLSAVRCPNNKQHNQSFPLQPFQDLLRRIELITPALPLGDKCSSVAHELLLDCHVALKSVAAQENPIRLQFTQPVSIENITLVDIQALKALTGKSRATLHRWLKKGLLPPPHRTGSCQNIWTLADLRPYLTALGSKEGV